MASISRNPGGRRTAQFVVADGKRKSIRVGKVAVGDAVVSRLKAAVLEAMAPLVEPVSAKAAVRVAQKRAETERCC